MNLSCESPGPGRVHGPPCERVCPSAQRTSVSSVAPAPRSRRLCAAHSDTPPRGGPCTPRGPGAINAPRCALIDQPATPARAPKARLAAVVHTMPVAASCGSRCLPRDRNPRPVRSHSPRSAQRSCSLGVTYRGRATILSKPNDGQSERSNSCDHRPCGRAVSVPKLPTPNLTETVSATLGPAVTPQ